ncbi:MAG TPA: YggT family protein [Burkholderiales bacterium]|jgi:YggT family protein
MTYFSQAGLYLIQLVFGFYILLVLLRLLFQLVRASFYNPVSQFIVTLTQPPMQFLRRFIPGLFGVDMAAVVLLLALQILEIYVIAWFQGASPAAGGVVVIAVAQLIEFTVYVFIVAIFIRIILSWVNPYGTRHPVGDLLHSLTEPLLAPARRLIPPIGGLDLSPIAVFVLLQLTLILIVRPLRDFGGALLIS